MIIRCKRCGEFFDFQIKMCGKCGWTNNLQIWTNDCINYVKIGNARGGILHKYVMRDDGKVVELLPARTHRQRRKFVANRKHRKYQKVR
jgi:hypothetical protein